VVEQYWSPGSVMAVLLGTPHQFASSEAWTVVLECHFVTLPLFWYLLGWELYAVSCLGKSAVEDSA